MFKKTLTIFLVLLSCACISFSASATPAVGVNPNTSMFGADSTGIGLNTVAGIQYIRGAITNSNGSTLNTVAYLDFNDDTFTNFDFSDNTQRSYAGTFDYVGSTGDYVVSGLESWVSSGAYGGYATTVDNSTRYNFPASYIWDSYGADVGFQWVIKVSENASRPTPIFKKGDKGYIHFTLYFDKMDSITDLNFRVTSPDSRYLIGASGDTGAVWDNSADFKYLGGCMLGSAGSSKIIGLQLDEPASNNLCFRIPITFNEDAQLYAYPKGHSGGSTIYYWCHRFNFLISNFKYSYSEAAAAEKAADDASAEGEDAVSGEAAESASTSFNNIAEAMSYNGTECTLNIPSFTWGLGSIIPERTWFDGTTIDFTAYINQFVPSNIMSIIRALCDIAIVMFCVKELYDLISTVLVNRKAGDDSDG